MHIQAITCIYLFVLVFLTTTLTKVNQRSETLYSVGQLLL